MAAELYEEEVQFCRGPSGGGYCPYRFKARMTRRGEGMADEEGVTRRIVKATCRCGGSVSFSLTREAHRRGDWTIDWFQD
jgi:hypothetical protein